MTLVTLPEYTQFYDYVNKRTEYNYYSARVTEIREKMGEFIFAADEATNDRMGRRKR